MAAIHILHSFEMLVVQMLNTEIDKGRGVKFQAQWEYDNLCFRSETFTYTISSDQIWRQPAGSEFFIHIFDQSKSRTQAFRPPEIYEHHHSHGKRVHKCMHD